MGYEKEEEVRKYEDHVEESTRLETMLKLRLGMTELRVEMR